MKIHRPAPGEAAAQLEEQRRRYHYVVDYPNYSGDDGPEPTAINPRSNKP